MRQIALLSSLSALVAACSPTPAPAPPPVDAGFIQAARTDPESTTGATTTKVVDSSSGGTPSGSTMSAATASTSTLVAAHVQTGAGTPASTDVTMKLDVKDPAWSAALAGRAASQPKADAVKAKASAEWLDERKHLQATEAARVQGEPRREPK